MNNEFVKQVEYNIIYLQDIINKYQQTNNQKIQIIKSSYENLLNVLQEIKIGICVNPNLILDLIEPQNAKIDKIKDVEFSSNFIDETQGLAVKKALAMDNLLTIQGPPGAGKTTTITEIIKQVKKRSPLSKILITSQSHVAVDNVIKKLANEGFKHDLARVRHTDKTENMMKKYDIDVIYKEIINKSSSNIKKVLDSYNCLNDNQEYDNAFVSQNRDGFMLSKSIIGVTINSINSCRFGIKGDIDYAIIDEVGKCSFAEILMIAQMCKKLILIGDPKQLPAVMEKFKDEQSFNNEIYDYLSDNPYISYLFSHINKECRVFLNKQYRMSDAIGEYISDNFYNEPNEKLRNGEGKKNILIEDALNFIDYDIRGYEINTANKKENEDTILMNKREIEIIEYLLNNELKSISPKKIAIIAPYIAQISEIRKIIGDRIPAENINTVDAFQGREADYVIFSCVRNFGRPTEFFKKENRLNVAISRAIEKVYIIGSEYYVTKVSYLKNFVDFKKNIKGKTVRCNRLYYNGKNIEKNKRSRVN